MALLDSEVDRIRFELGYNTLSSSAVPYVGITAIFDEVISAYLRAGASTTSTTAVSAESVPTAVELTIASAADFAVGDAVVVDVDSLQERATIQAMTGSIITVLLKLDHATSYPVTVEGGESIVREILVKIRKVADQMVDTALVAAGLTRAEDIEFGADGDSPRAQLDKMIEYYRRDLASVLGVAYLRDIRRGDGQSVVLT